MKYNKNMCKVGPLKQIEVGRGPENFNLQLKLAYYSRDIQLTWTVLAVCLSYFLFISPNALMSLFDFNAQVAIFQSFFS